jgi:hypothetical protein
MINKYYKPDWCEIQNDPKAPRFLFATDGYGVGVSYNSETWKLHIFVRGKLQYCPSNWTIA